MLSTPFANRYLIYSGWAFEITYLANTNYDHLITAIKRLSLREFTLWGRDLMCVVNIREIPYYGGFFDNFFGTLETVRIRGMSVPRGS